MIPLYDNEDIVCGIIYNNVPYYFHRNLQNDIIAIVDKTGNVLARYTYDAWGHAFAQQEKAKSQISTRLDIVDTTATLKQDTTICRAVTTIPQPVGF